jgi:hypothetical protein
MGGESNLPTSILPHRRKKKKKGWFRSCLIRLQLVSERRKTIESGLSASRGRKIAFPERCSFCFCVACMAFTFVISLGLYNSLVAVDRRYANLIVRSTTNFPEDLVAEISNMRRSDIELNALPIVLYNGETTLSAKHDVEHSLGGKFHYPHELHRKEQREMMYVDFGDIDLKLLAGDDQKRQMYILVKDRQGEARSLNAARDDDFDEIYYAFDDGMLLSETVRVACM